MSTFNFNTPNIDTGQMNNEKYVKKIANSLLSMEEYLRYMFANLDEDNFTQEFANYVENLTAKELHVTNGKNTINITPTIGIEILKGLVKTLYLDMDGKVNMDDIIARSGEIAGFKFSEDKETGGLVFDDPTTGKFIRLNPYSTWTGEGTYNEEYGSIDIGISADRKNTIAHFRSDGYIRFGLTSESGESIRINDYLRYDKGIVGATNTIFYSKHFQIYRDGTTNIVSPDVPKALASAAITKNVGGQITSMGCIYVDNTTATVNIGYDANGNCTSVGDSVFTY